MLSLATTALFATAATARLMDSLPAVPKGWTALREAGLDEPITLRVALPQQHADALEKAVIEMSTPGHANYGKHMSRLELRSYTAPTEEAVSSVVGWLSDSGVKQKVVNNDWISFSTTVEKANKLLNTTFGWYQYKEGGGPKLRSLDYSVPDEIAKHVDLIQPTTRFGQLGAKKSTIFDMHILEPEEEAKIAATDAADAAAADCNVSQITPACLKSLYNIKYTPSASGNLVAFASYLEEYARYSDLAAFESRWLTSAVGQNFSVQLVNGGLNNQNSNSDSGMFGVCPLSGINDVLIELR